MSLSDKYYLSQTFDSFWSDCFCSSSGMTLTHNFSMAPTHLKQALLQTRFSTPDLGNFSNHLIEKTFHHNHSKPNSILPKGYYEIWVNCATHSNVKHGNSLTKTSPQRLIEVEHSFIQEKHNHLMQSKSSKVISQKWVCTFKKLYFS